MASDPNLEQVATKPEVVVNAVGLVKVFKDFWNRPKSKAVNDLDFEVREGEVLGLLGPNGSGKSTTVKMLLGLLYPTAGRLTVFGKSPRDVETKKRIGYLPEESYLYKYLTAYETLDFFASLFNLSAEERKTRCNQLLEMVGLSHARNRPVGEFSKGMARRIGLAQAMINDPALLVLDEPTSGLDPLGCREVKDLILMLKKRGKTVIVTSHLLSDVEDVCDRVIILYGGRIRAQGTLNELLTIENNMTISTPQLPPEVLEKVLATLRANLQDNEFKLSHPRMTLEDFFLDVVNKARQESVETFGARGGGHIASYLTAGVKEENQVVDAVKRLDELSGRVQESPKEPAQPETGNAPQNVQVNEKALEALSRDVPPPETNKETPDSKPDLSEANKKLMDMLSGNPKNGE